MTARHPPVTRRPRSGAVPAAPARVPARTSGPARPAASAATKAPAPAEASDTAADAASPYQRIYAVTRRIPRGRVATYGQIARLAQGCTARMVGYAMAALHDGNDVPWHRVINAQGRISARSGGDGATRQTLRLAKEGIAVDAGGRIDLARHRWDDASAVPPELRQAESADRERSETLPPVSAKARVATGSKAGPGPGSNGGRVRGPRRRPG